MQTITPNRGFRSMATASASAASGLVWVERGLSVDWGTDINIDDVGSIPRSRLFNVGDTRNYNHVPPLEQLLSLYCSLPHTLAHTLARTHAHTLAHTHTLTHSRTHAHTHTHARQNWPTFLSVVRRKVSIHQFCSFWLDQIRLFRKMFLLFIEKKLFSCIK